MATEKNYDPPGFSALEQQGLNVQWLIARIDEIHECLCPGHIGTWQQRAEAAVAAARKISGNAE